jgi:hypothetical protein
MSWHEIRRYYRRHEAAILRAGANAWGLDPYQWEFEAGISLTPIERMFWYDVRNAGVVLYPQYPVGRFFVDFANPAAKVAIECDGAQFHMDTERDAERQAAIEALGWSVFRITGSDCCKDDAFDDEGRRVALSPGVVLLAKVRKSHSIRIGRTAA